MGSFLWSRLWKMRGVDLGKEVGLETRFHFLTNRDNDIRAFPHKSRPAGNTDPPRIRSIAYGSIRLVGGMADLLVPLGGEASFPLTKTENFEKLPGITLQKYPKMTKFGTKLKRLILVSKYSSR